MTEQRRLGQESPKVHVYVATPAYDGKVETQFSQSMAEAAFCSPLYQVYFSAAIMGNGAFIDLARNLFVKWFLEDKDQAGYTHLFFIDSDLKFEPRAFIGLARAGQPICAGVYRRRQEPEDYPATLWEHPEMGGLWVEDGWVMAKRVPTGFLCISRQVLEEMAADAPKLNIEGQDGPVPRLFYTKIDEQNRFVGEDFAFCDDYVKKYNRPIPVWPDIDFEHGKFPCNYNKFLERNVRETEEKLKAEQDAATRSDAA